MKFYSVETKRADGYALVKKLEVKQTSSGSDYLDITFCDKEGEVNGKIWTASNGNGIKEGDVVYISGSVELYKEQPQIKVAKIRKATDEDGVNITDFVPSAPYNPVEMLEYIEEIVDGFKDNDYKEVVKKYINEKKEKLIYWPAATGMHHAIRGGLLFHTMSMLRQAKVTANNYLALGYEINEDLLYAGVILHDLPKVEEIGATEVGIPTEYSVTGNMIGHIVMGAINIDRIGRILNVPEEKLTLLEHLIISHHEKPEWGAAKPPMCIEAIILASVDVLDARMYEFQDAINQVENGEMTPKCFAAGNVRIYKHN